MSEFGNCPHSDDGWCMGCVKMNAHELEIDKELGLARLKADREIKELQIKKSEKIVSSVCWMIILILLTVMVCVFCWANVSIRGK